tara:strand:+ start:192 stop:695 length:504 start_codon:yes stop_codon:yes gene_type:complete
MIIIKFFDDKNMVSVRDLTQNEINEFTGFDICIFQQWNSIEHGPIDLEKTNKPMYNLMKKQNLIHSSYSQEESYDGLNEFNWYDIIEWNNLRNNSSIVAHNSELADEKYSLKLGIVYKFVINDTCVCIDYTSHIIKIQKKWRAYIAHLKNPTTIMTRCLSGKNIKFC